MDSGLNDFMRQIPQGFILMFCGSGILLVLVIGYSIRERIRKANAVTTAAADDEPLPQPMSEADFGDLPDLDDLASAELKAQSQAVPPRAVGAHIVALAGGENVEAVEVLTVLRDVGEGGLIIQIGGKAYRNPPSYADADFKRRLHNTLRDLNSVQAAANAATPIPEAAPDVFSEDDEEEVAAAPLPPAVAPPIASQEIPRLSPHEPAPGDLPKFRMPEGPPVKPKRGQKLVREAIPEINIAGSIEAFLQHKLVRTMQYTGRSIHVVPASHGGVNIEVDGSFYDSVAEVEDVGVRQFLAATIEEWQSRQ